MTPSNWRKITEESYICGYRKVKRRFFQLPNNQIDKFDIVEEAEIAVVLAFTSAQEVIVTRQFRPGPEKILTDLPGGYLDTAETPTEAARRHLLQDTGYTGELVLVTSSFENPYSTRVRHNFVATDCVLVPDVNPSSESFKQVNLVSLASLQAILQSGQSDDISTAFLGLQYLGINFGPAA